VPSNLLPIPQSRIASSPIFLLYCRCVDHRTPQLQMASSIKDDHFHTSSHLSLELPNQDAWEKAPTTGRVWSRWSSFARHEGPLRKFEISRLNCSRLMEQLPFAPGSFDETARRMRQNAPEGPNAGQEPRADGRTQVLQYYRLGHRKHFKL
jgi:hypothetical protein